MSYQICPYNKIIGNYTSKVIFVNKNYQPTRIQGVQRRADSRSKFETDFNV